MEDSTFMLIHSSEKWKIEEKEISETTRYDRNKQKYTVVTIPIYQDKNFRPGNSHIHDVNCNIKNDKIFLNKNVVI